jgi:hypothetical protein
MLGRCIPLLADAGVLLPCVRGMFRCVRGAGHNHYTKSVGREACGTVTNEVSETTEMPERPVSAVDSAYTVEAL